MNTKGIKYLTIFIGIVFPIMLSCLLLIAAGTASLFYNGFGIDSNDSLYLGVNSKINVYKDGIITDAIKPRTSRGYIFTIQKDDTILLSTGSTVYTLDLNGKEISQQEDYKTRNYNEIKRMNKPFHSYDDEEYFMSSSWGRMKIIHISDKGNEVIYIQPILDYIIRIVLLMVIISIFIFVPIIIAKSNGSFDDNVKRFIEGIKSVKKPVKKN